METKCDLCSQKATHDGKTRMGPWAFMCGSCFKTYGIGLGLGKGQILACVRCEKNDFEEEVN